MLPKLPRKTHHLLCNSNTYEYLLIIGVKPWAMMRSRSKAFFRKIPDGNRDPFDGIFG
jgi:hypothetical protein